MTIPRVMEINAYQKHSPPVHVMVAAYFGIGTTASEKDESGMSIFDVAPRTVK